jgi:hypothetical protein
MNSDQAHSDERDNSVVFRYLATVVIVVALLAIAYNLVLHKRNGVPAITQTQSAPATPSVNSTNK